MTKGSTQAGEWAAIFETSSIKTASAWGKDTNYPLLLLTLSSIRQNLEASPLLIYTGDLLGHGIPQYFYGHINGSQLPRDLADVAAMKAFTDKALAFVMGQVRGAAGNIPVMFAVGNGDSYSGYGPNHPDSSFNQDSTFLPDTVELFYSKFLNGSVDHQAFITTFTSGGYYSAEPPGTNLMVLGLNTILFALPGNTGIIADEFAWLDSRLASAQAAGKKVWLLMHAPPGADIGTTTSHADSNGHIDATTAAMIWLPDYQTNFLRILAKYPGVISLTLAGHTHMDEYRTLPSGDVIEITPAISPCFTNDPAFKIFSFSQETLKPTDYSSFNYDLATNPGQFDSYYTFSTAYSRQGLLGPSLAQLAPEFATDNAKQAIYRGLYFSGHNSPNPITDTNWPIHWCGIGIKTQLEFIDCVNSY